MNIPTERTAIVIVDMQNDFGHPDGNLYVQDGEQLVEPVNQFIIDNPDALVVYTRDDHIDPGAHFAAEGTEPDFNDTWPAHCEQGTWGAEFLEGLKVVGDPNETVFYKGNFAASYTGFDGKNQNGETLNDYLQRHNITKVVAVGIAFDFCVKATAKDARLNGYVTEVRLPLTVAVNAPLPDGGNTADDAAVEMNHAGVNLSRYQAKA